MWCLESVARFEGIQAVWKYGYTVWYNPLLLYVESVQLEMHLPTLEGIGHARILLLSGFAFTELFSA